MQEIQKLLIITQKLRSKYKRGFRLDGKLVGDIREVLAAEKYGLNLLPENTFVNDAVNMVTGKLVHIKSSFKGSFIFPASEERIPNCPLYIKISHNGANEKIYNEHGRFIFDEYIVKKKLKSYRNLYYSLS